jgi:hypothetical protein
MIPSKRLADDLVSVPEPVSSGVQKQLGSVLFPSRVVESSQRRSGLCSPEWVYDLLDRPRQGPEAAMGRSVGAQGGCREGCGWHLGGQLNEHGRRQLPLVSLAGCRVSMPRQTRRTQLASRVLTGSVCVFPTRRSFPYRSLIPYAKVILGARYSVRLTDPLAPDCVFARCLACGTVCRIAPHRLYDRFHPDERLKRIGERMKCTRCGTGPGISWHILRASWEKR